MILRLKLSASVSVLKIVREEAIERCGVLLDGALHPSERRLMNEFLGVGRENRRGNDRNKEGDDSFHLVLSFSEFLHQAGTAAHVCKAEIPT